LLFDEATASLDTQTEKNIQENIEEVTKHTTSIVIAHRLSTITHADNILVLQDGEIVDAGTHQELIKKKGLYYSMWNSQQQKSAS
jgi:ATP-binding cassette subfamily B protein